MVSGWGLNKNLVLNTKFPKTGEILIVNNKRCFENNPILSVISSQRTFCGVGESSEQPCNGDGGAGLVFNKENKWYLRGIVSVSVALRGKCELGTPVIFTNVANFIDWIANLTGV